MHLIFGHISNWTIPLLKILSYFKLKIFYIHIEADNIKKKSLLAEKLKSIRIFPLALEHQKDISTKVKVSECVFDQNQYCYKKNQKLVSESNLQNYCKLFSISRNESEKFRLLIQDFIFGKHEQICGRLIAWSKLNEDKKIFYISFKFSCFYLPHTQKNLFKIIFPTDFIFFFIKVLKKKIFNFTIYIRNRSAFKICEKNTKEDIYEKSFAVVTHKGIYYGTRDNLLYEHILYYSDDINSPFHKKNILHLDYSNTQTPEENLLWVNLRKIKISYIKIYFKIIFACLKTFYLIRNWETFLGWNLCILKYAGYLRYLESLEKFKKLKAVFIAYDILCPKTLVLALEKKKILTFATQERFMQSFCKSSGSVFVDTYFTASNYSTERMKLLKNFQVKKFVSVGQYRSDYISLFNNTIPKEILHAKEKGKKIIVVLGTFVAESWFEGCITIGGGHSDHMQFLEDMIRLSNELNNTFIVLRFKDLNWKNNPTFKKLIEKINESKNIIFSDNYRDSFHSYKLCANSDLIIAKHTSLADECLAYKKPVLFHEYTHNMKAVISETIDCYPKSILCYEYDEIVKKAKSFLFDANSYLFRDIENLYNKVYYIDGSRIVKSKILENLEKQIKTVNI